MPNLERVSTDRRLFSTIYFGIVGGDYNVPIQFAAHHFLFNLPSSHVLALNPIGTFKSLIHLSKISRAFGRCYKLFGHICGFDGWPGITKLGHEGT